MRELIYRLMFPVKWFYYSVVILILQDSYREHRDIYFKELEDNRAFGGRFHYDSHLMELKQDILEREQQIDRWKEKRRAL